jgi:uncharacterized protein YqhQ
MKCDRVLRIMFAPERESLFSSYSSSDMVLESLLRMMILTGYVVYMEMMRTVYRILLRKAVGERPPGDFGV